MSDADDPGWDVVGHQREMGWRTEVSYLTGEKTRIEPHNLDDRGQRLAPGQRCKVTIGDADPIILDREQMQGWIGYMDKWSK